MNISAQLQTPAIARPAAPRADSSPVSANPFPPSGTELRVGCSQEEIGERRHPRPTTLFVHGEVDYRVPLEGAIQLYTSLKKQGVPAKLIIYEGMPHSIRGHWNQIHRMMNELRWWETYSSPWVTCGRTVGGESVIIPGKRSVSALRNSEHRNRAQ